MWGMIAMSIQNNMTIGCVQLCIEENSRNLIMMYIELTRFSTPLFSEYKIY